MSRYIDADMITYQNYIRVDGCCSAETEPYVTKNFINDMPEEDVVPVVHGKWLPQFVSTRDLTNIFSCSNCNVSVRLLHKKVKCSYKYCPHCGAKMEEK